jgi:hypothetical protein
MAQQPMPNKSNAKIPNKVGLRSNLGVGHQEVNSSSRAAERARGGTSSIGGNFAASLFLVVVSVLWPVMPV